MTANFNREVNGIVDEILDDYRKGRDIDQMEISNHLDRTAVINLTKTMLRILFPGYYREGNYDQNGYRNLKYLVEDAANMMIRQIEIALSSLPEFREADAEVVRQEAEKKTIAFFHCIPHVRDLVNTDIEATYDGDPAASSKEEIVLSYPGLLASTIARLAHELYLMKIPFIPRMMTEYAHSTTGVDIHPGATIGRYFFIDHATGVVVGETAEIGEHVKLYQGITIGALSTRGGQSLRGKKRHPTIEDNVTIYSGASILGGDTVIGKGAIIGGNAFITSSVAPGTRVSIKKQELLINDAGRSGRKTEV